LYQDGQVVGALMVQLRLDPFNRIMQSSHELGDSFESYLVSRDGKMLSQSRFVEDSIFTLDVDTPSVNKALSGATGFGIIEDYRGKSVLSAYQPYKWTGGQWAVVAEFDESELKEDGSFLRLMITIAGASLVLVAGLVGWVIAARERERSQGFRGHSEGMCPSGRCCACWPKTAPF